MIQVLTREQIRQLERIAIGSGTSEDALIERVAKGAFDCLQKRCNKESDKILIVCGGGNNGADGLSLALNLKANGFFVSVLTVFSRCNQYVLHRLNDCKKGDIDILSLKTVNFADFTVFIDALFGTGLCREIVGAEREAIERFNNANGLKFALDIPSGIDADSGEILGICAVVDETLTFLAIKTGTLSGVAINYTGKLTYIDIDLGEFPLKPTDEKVFVIEKNDFTLPKRERLSHKYDYGKVVIIGGCERMAGAPLLAFEASCVALSSGAGLCTLAVPDCLKPAYLQRVREQMLEFLPSKDGSLYFDEVSVKNAIKKADSVVVGMGMPSTDELKKLVTFLATSFEGNLILDAGALAIVDSISDKLKKHKCRSLILTPHSGEFERITFLNSNKNEALTERIKALAISLNAIVAYKSAVSITTDGKRLAFNISGTPSMAKGGTGDVLAGMIATLCKRLDPFSAVCLSCFSLGKAGERAQAQKGSEGVLATDIINNLSFD